MLMVLIFFVWLGLAKMVWAMDMYKPMKIALEILLIIFVLVILNAMTTAFG